MDSKSRKTVRTSVLLPEDARAQIEALAAANDVSAAWVMRHAILKFLQEHAGQRELPLSMPAARRSEAS
jgi:predicted transcriptional regulator